MATYGEYTTLADLRASGAGQIDTTKLTDDALLLAQIRATSRELDELARRFFFPLIDTREYDTPQDALGDLRLDTDLLEVTTLTNGDGQTIASTKYKLYPLNYWPKFIIRPLPSQGTPWQLSSGGDRSGAIGLASVWGYHRDYPNAWPSLTTLAAAITTTTATSTTAPTGFAKIGQLIKVDSEYIYISGLSVGLTNDTLTIIRGVNGSTAATHLTIATVYVWEYGAELSNLCKIGAAAYYKLRANPIGETVTINNITFSTPKDVRAYLYQALQMLGLLRTTL